METAWESPHRIKPEEWAKLVKDLGVVTPPDSARPVRLRKTRGALPADGSVPASAWGIALARVGRVGRDLGEGRFALLCPWDDTHSEPEGSTENAAGSCVLLPPTEGSYMGLPKCSHAHCVNRKLRDWIEAVGPETYADALAEAQGWRRALGYLRTTEGVFFAKKVPLQLGDEPTPEPGELVEAKPGAPVEGPFKWKPGGRLLHFAAEIAADVREHDASGVRRSYELAGSVDGRPFKIRVPSSEFAAMKWVAAELGARAVIEPGRGTVDHARAALQLTSTPREHDVYALTGWREVGGAWVYLHAGGALGAEGPVEGLEVSLEDGRIALLGLPAPLAGDALGTAIREEVALWRLAPSVTAIAFPAVFRSLLAPSGLTISLHGPQQSGKTGLATIVQQHVGAGFRERALMGSWKHSTAGSLITKLGIVGDAPFVVDDYLISGNGEDGKFNEKVDQVVRAQHGGAEAGRLHRDGGLARSGPAPRGTLFSTGESLPPGASLRSRMVMTDMPVALPDYSRFKTLAREGVFAGLVAAFLVWLAPRIGAVRAGITEEAERIAESLAEGRDQRTALMLAEVALGAKYFLEFAVAHGLPSAESEALKSLAWAVLKASRVEQATHQASQAPVARFLELVPSGLSTGHGYLSRPDGEEPPDCTVLGWSIVSTPIITRDGEVLQTRYTHRGDHLGYIDDGLVWLFLDAAHALVRRLAASSGDPFTITREDLPKRLHEAGLLARTELKTRSTYCVRKKVGGKIVARLLCLKASTLWPEPDALDAVEEAVSKGGGSDTAPGETPGKSN